MTESQDTTTDSIADAGRYPGADNRDRRLHRALAWVGIIAGVTFTVAVIFFSGLALGRASGGYHGWNRGHPNGQMAPGGCPMMGNGPMMGQNGGRMMDPEDMGPGRMGPGQSPFPSPAPPAR